ncbi:agmatine deiminase family protein [Abyssibacter profundi]|uniref:Agmatine deiminase n=1 Tax=Abyssibacter profundi TaxID=2182787 RepID=A0A363UKE1_9GAMM|nr:agmatine deiminase family protein [Abyssibacter profundi]PWN55899.1 agmatine deiminase [Abyssibacter profundi]
MSIHWPAEFEPQSRVLLTWPHVGTDWGRAFSDVEPVFRQLAGLITQQADLIVAAQDPAHVREQLAIAAVPADRVHIVPCHSDDVWARDHGPITVFEETTPRALDFRFDGWGGKFDARQDNRITQQLDAAGVLRPAQRVNVDWTLEGGGIETDGQGCLLATEACLLDPRRNPQVERHRLERQLHEWLGIVQLLWLSAGHLEGDDTDSHIDTLARFVSPEVIAYQACDDALDSHHGSLSTMRDQLRELRHRDGHAFDLVPLPLPAPQTDEFGRRLPAGYANFLILNDLVLVPVYKTAADDLALRRLDDAFAGRRIEPVDCRALITQNGSLHCVTMNIPRMGDGT